MTQKNSNKKAANYYSGFFVYSKYFYFTTAIICFTTNNPHQYTERGFYEFYLCFTFILKATEAVKQRIKPFSPGSVKSNNQTTKKRLHKERFFSFQHRVV